MKLVRTGAVRVFLAATFVFSPALAAKSDLELIGTQRANYFFVVSKPWIFDSDYLEQVARAFCRGKGVCFAHFWEKGTPAARSLPMSDEEAAAQLASYQGDKMLWRCGKYQVATSKNCFDE